jgi:hypothetical protein
MKDTITLEIEVSLHCEPEDMPVRGNAMSSGNTVVDEETESAILADLNSGNLWAWCVVVVKAELHGLTGAAYLGGCSYKSEADFRADPYFTEMVKEAKADLVSQINARLEKVTKL